MQEMKLTDCYKMIDNYFRNNHRNSPSSTMTSPSSSAKFETGDEEILYSHWLEESLISSDKREIIILESPPKEISKEKTNTPLRSLKHGISLSDDEVSIRSRKEKTTSRKRKKWYREGYSEYSDENERSSSNRPRKSKTTSTKSAKWSRERYVEYSDENEPRYRSKRTPKSTKRSREIYSEYSDENEPRCRSRSNRPRKSKTISTKSAKWSRERYLEYSDENESRYRSRKSPKSKKRSRERYSEHSDEDEQRYRSRRNSRPIKRKEPEERNPMAVEINNFHEYICEICNIKFNREGTWKTHMIGKKHQKAVKPRAIHEIVMRSLSSNQFERERSRADRYPYLPPGIKHVTLHIESLIQAVAEQYRGGPLPGLSKIIEIRHLENKKMPPVSEITYYCKLCDSPCASISIMMHLTGFKHQLRFFEIIEPRLYHKFRYVSKGHVESRVLKYLTHYERKYGRGTIEVKKEIVKETIRAPQPGPSRRNDGPSVDMDFQDTDITSIEDLDTSQNDYHCTVCDAHMNNKSVWESHVRGKRHLTNKKKNGGSPSKLKSVRCPGEVVYLEDKLEDEVVPIVGLEYVRETRGVLGNMYNCFLCGACTSEYDFMDHLKSTKHRMKFLESENRKGKANYIEHIKSLHDVSTFCKDSLIEDECRTILEKYGPGEVEVYKS